MNALRWKNGCILHPKRHWEAWTQRRIPKLFVTPRASEVVLKVYFKDDYFWFEETDVPVEKVKKARGKKLLNSYKNRYLLPEKAKRKELLEYLKKDFIYIFREKLSEKMYFSTNPNFR